MKLFKCRTPKNAYDTRYVKVVKGHKTWYERQCHTNSHPGGDFYWETGATFKTIEEVEQDKAPRIETEL